MVICLIETRIFVLFAGCLHEETSGVCRAESSMRLLAEQPAASLGQPSGISV